VPRAASGNTTTSTAGPRCGADKRTGFDIGHGHFFQRAYAGLGRQRDRDRFTAAAMHRQQMFVGRNNLAANALRRRALGQGRMTDRERGNAQQYGR
jgi:hypothetical protein